MSKFSIVDETGKEREATLICNICYDSENFSIYAIDRDSDNTNVFVSKVIRNTDNTALLVDIYDPTKKSCISEIVKEVISAKDISLLKEKNIDVFSDVDYINSSGLTFTTYKTYVFSIKKELYDRVFKRYNLNNDGTKISDKNNDEAQNDYIELVEEKPNLMKDFPQKVNEEKNTLYKINEKKAGQIEDAFKKITIEKLDFNNEDNLRDMFNEEKVTTVANSKGFASSLILTLIGLGAFAITLIFLILQLK